MTTSEPIRVLVTGAAGRIGYSLSALILSGQIFGAKQLIILHLLDVAEEAEHLAANAMELCDCAFPLLKAIVPTSDSVIAFTDISAAFLLSGVEMAKRDARSREVMNSNARIFRDEGRYLDSYARKDCKVLVAASFCHTMAFVVSHYAPSIPKENISALARLDLNCALGQVAFRLEVPTSHIKNISVWGNHSDTTFTDVSHASVLQNNQYKRVVEVLSDEQFARNQLMETVTSRNKTTRRLTNAISTAKALADQMRDWIVGTLPGQFVSMGVLSDGSYNVPKDLMSSFPVEVQKGKWIIAKGLKMDEFAKAKLDATVKELSAEKVEVLAELEKD